MMMMSVNHTATAYTVNTKSSVPSGRPTGAAPSYAQSLNALQHGSPARRATLNNNTGHHFCHQPYAPAAIGFGGSLKDSMFSEPSDDTRSTGSGYSTESGSGDSGFAATYEVASMPASQLPPPPPPPAYSATVGGGAPVLPPRAAVAPVTVVARVVPANTIAPRARRHNPYAPLPTQSSRTVMYGASHQPLVGRCRYVAWPDLRAKTVPLFTPEQLTEMPRLAIEQVKFELTAPQLRWVIHELAGVVAAHVEENATTRGSFVAYFKNAEDQAAAQSKLHRNVLFDHNGAWAAADADETAAVAQYMGSREFRQRGQRLPRDLMTVGPSSRRTSPVISGQRPAQRR